MFVILHHLKLLLFTIIIIYNFEYTKRIVIGCYRQIALSQINMMLHWVFCYLRRISILYINDRFTKAKHVWSRDGLVVK